MPKFTPETNLLQASRTVIVKKDLGFLATVIVKVLTVLRLVEVISESKDTIVMNNLTLINFFLIKLGPMMSEVRLTTYLLLFQVFCSCVAFVIRYPMASHFYDS